MKDTFERTRKFIYRNARPLDFARWRYHFEGGSREEVLRALCAYQNEDGGFGHALEPDCWNPNSLPMGTWAATEYVREIGLTDRTHPLVQGILRYLESEKDFDSEKRLWLDTIPSSNDYPGAFWWRYDGKGSHGYTPNPTAALAGFIICYADRDSALWQRGASLAREAFEWLVQNVPFDDEMKASCMVALYEYCLEAGTDFLDMERFRELLVRQVNHVICRDPEKWFTEYRPKPSMFIKDRTSPFLPGNESLAEEECRRIRSNQEEDGGYPVTWTWGTGYDREFAISANWWRCSFAIQNMLFLKAFS